MASTSMLISPSIPIGLNRRIELSGLDLWLLGRIDQVFVYPSDIHIDRLTDALARTLSAWPLVAGHGYREDDRYFIVMADHAIPVTLVHNDELSGWPLDSKVVVEMNDNPLSSFLDEVQTMKSFDNVSDEPMLRIKLTQIRQSNEWILGVSWSHALGDAAACLHFCSTLSCLYQQLEPPMPSPIFERRLWSKEEADPSLVPLMKHLRDAKPVETVMQQFVSDQSTYDPVNLQFSGDHLQQLRSLVDDQTVTIHDALVAYIILTWNQICVQNNEGRCLKRTNMVINIRNVDDSIAPAGLVANPTIMMTSEDFTDPYSLTSIAKTIRQSIVQSRDPLFLKRYVATMDGLMRENLKNNRYPDSQLSPEEIVINSNYRYDWSAAVDFGHTDQCRFYTARTGPMYLRIFRLNPEKNGNQWLPRDRHGAEIAFRVQKHLRESFIATVARDIGENFQNICR